MSTPTPEGPERPTEPAGAGAGASPVPAPGEVGFGACYRPPDRDSGVRCSRCARPICPSCMISAPVGFQCPECVKGAPAVRTLRSLQRDPYATWVLMAVNIALFLPSLGGGAGLLSRGNPLADDFALYGPDVAAGEWWQLITSGFLHYGVMHLAFNMLALYLLGAMIESSLGPARFLGIYFSGLLAGSLGALLLSFDARTAGASGAVYGLMGAAFVLQRRRGVDPMQSGIGGLLVVNLLFTFAIPGISIGGHLGGLVGGGLAGMLVAVIEDARKPAWLGVLATAAVVAAAVVGALAVADGRAI